MAFGRNNPQEAPQMSGTIPSQVPGQPAAGGSPWDNDPLVNPSAPQQPTPQVGSWIAVSPAEQLAPPTYAAPSTPPPGPGAAGAPGASGEGKRKKKPEKAPGADANKAPNPKTPYQAAFPGPSKPSAILVPSYIRDRTAAAKTLRIVIAACVALAVLLTLSSAFLFIRANSARGAADNAAQQQVAVQQQVAQLQPVANYYDGLVARQSLTIEALKGDIDYSPLLRYITQAAAPGVEIVSVSVDTANRVCDGDNPFDPAPYYGCMRVNMKFGDREAFEATIGALQKGNEYVAGAFISGPIGLASGEFAVGIRFTADVLSLRYVPEDQKEAVKAAALAQSIGAAPVAPGTPAAVPGATAGATPATAPATTPATSPAPAN